MSNQAHARNQMYRTEIVQLFFLTMFYPWIAFVLTVAIGTPIAAGIWLARRLRVN